MKLYLDDVRPVPEGWVGAKTMLEATQILKESFSDITHLSFDHDLGDDDRNGTGYDVACFLEGMVYATKTITTLPVMTVHSANPVGGARIVQAITSMMKIVNERNELKCLT